MRLYDTKIILTTLFFDEEIRFKEAEVTTKIDNKELDLAIRLIESLKGVFEPEKYRDEYQDKVKEAIDAKLKVKKVVKSKKRTKKEVTDLMKALEKSLKK